MQQVSPPIHTSSSTTVSSSSIHTNGAQTPLTVSNKSSLPSPAPTTIYATTQPHIIMQPVPTPYSSFPMTINDYYLPQYHYNTLAPSHPVMPLMSTHPTYPASIPPMPHSIAIPHPTCCVVPSDPLQHRNPIQNEYKEIGKGHIWI